MITMLRVLMEKVDNMWEQMGNVSTEMEILRKEQKEVLEIKNTVTEKRKRENLETKAIGVNHFIHRRARIRIIWTFL